MKKIFEKLKKQDKENRNIDKGKIVKTILWFLLLLIAIILIAVSASGTSEEVKSEYVNMNSGIVKIPEMNDNFYYGNYNGVDYMIPALQTNTDQTATGLWYGPAGYLDSDTIDMFVDLNTQFNHSDYFELMDALDYYGQYSLDMIRNEDLQSFSLYLNNFYGDYKNKSSFQLTNYYYSDLDLTKYSYDYRYTFNSPYLYNLGYTTLDKEDNSIDFNFFTDSYVVKSTDLVISLDLVWNQDKSRSYYDLRAKIEYYAYDFRGNLNFNSYEVTDLLLNSQEKPFSLVYSFNAEDTLSYKLGFESGKQDGYFYGHRDGVKEGIEIGEINGYNDGYNDGENAGYNLGYQKGFNEGSNDYNVFTMITMGLFNFLNVFGNIEIFPGFKIYYAIGIVVMLGLIAFIAGKRE